MSAAFWYASRVRVRLVARATATLGGDEDDGLWRLLAAIARVRDADPGQVELLAELLEVLARRAERSARLRRRPRPGPATRDADA